MQQISKLITNASKSPTTSAASSVTTGQTTSANGIDTEAVNYFYLRLSNIYNSKFTYAFPDTEAIDNSKREWAKFIGTHTRAALDAMFDELRLRKASGDREFDYIDIGKIISLIKTADGLPDAITAYRAACHREWTHPVVYKTLQDVGSFDLKTKSEKNIFPAWRRAYERNCDLWRAGLGRDWQVSHGKSLPKPDDVPMPREDALKEADKLLALFD